MSIPRGTTPTFTLTFSDNIDLTAAANVYVTFAQCGRTLTKTGSDLEVAAKSIAVYLTQEETLKFSAGPVKIQANWTTSDGGRMASEITTYLLTEQLLAGVVE